MTLLGDTPAHWCAWPKWMMGLITLTQITANTNDTSFSQVENAGGANHGVYHLLDNPSAVDWDWGNPGAGEYFLLENRRQFGHDSAIRVPVCASGTPTRRSRATTALTLTRGVRLQGTRVLWRWSRWTGTPTLRVSGDEPQRDQQPERHDRSVGLSELVQRRIDSEQQAVQRNLNVGTRDRHQCFGIDDDRRHPARATGNGRDLPSGIRRRRADGSDAVLGGARYECGRRGRMGRS